ncbi:Brl1/Brr6 domain-containing protein [Chlamydoabsidia padenii]|nr:Brl1/Brr6 domain-containing protein [Chlamydoabsidia padenii]
MLIYHALSAIQLEIVARIDEHTYDLESSIAQCRQKYRENQCSTMATSSILASYCEEWLKCMQKNPHVVKRAHIAARVFGELINSFFNALTLKTMFALGLLFFGSILISFAL